jgi:5'-nucleotidase
MQLQHARFPLIICNYDFTGTSMEQKYVPYKVFTKGKLKIGVTGAGIQLNGLVPSSLSGTTTYLNPIEEVNKVASFLKKEKGCDMVICLSHLGYQYKENPNLMCDLILAKETEFVDLIIGGHTHTFMNEPVTVKNKMGSDVVINQVGWAGLVLGRLDFEFRPGKRKNLAKAHTVIIGKKSNE